MTSKEEIKKLIPYLIFYITLYLNLYFMVIGLGIMLFSVQLFYKGFHNFDYSHNMELLMSMLDIKKDSIVDIATYNPCGYTSQNITKTTFTYTQGYMLGIIQTERAFWLFGVGAILFSTGVLGVLNEIENTKGAKLGRREISR